MRVIFLDIDGVLNSEVFSHKVEAQHKALGHDTSCTCLRVENQIDPDAMARLNRLAAATNAKIVISSSWRKLFDEAELHQTLIKHGLVAEIVGATPNGHKEPEMLEVYGHLERMYRGYEIDFWLRKHPEIDRFV